MDLGRDDALRFRLQQQGLGPGTGGDRPDDSPVLDLGVQDTGGPGAARWALALRGCAVDDAALVYAWTLRGAPHAYRRHEVAAVAAATAPYDEADAAKRVFDASRPLREAGIPVLEALDTVAGLMREIVDEPMGKGEVSTALSARLPAPYLRACRSCATTHAYEQTLRLSALPAGLELLPATSPPVLAPVDGWEGPAVERPGHLDPVRAAVRLLAPTTPGLVAGFLDAPVRTVRAHWPADTATVTVDGEPHEVLEQDLPQLTDVPAATGVRLLGAFDPWLQVRDRELLVADPARRKELWPVLGRPGAVLVGHEVVGTWRPRSKGDRLRLFVDTWRGGDLPTGLDEQAERLATHRGQRFDGWADA
jgi:hypothetical protein